MWQAMIDRPDTWIDGTLILRPHMNQRGVGAGGSLAKTPLTPADGRATPTSGRRTPSAGKKSSTLRSANGKHSSPRSHGRKTPEVS